MTAHPKIVRTFELLHDHKYYFIIMEYVKYGQLDEYLVGLKKLNEGTVKRIIK